ncbi:hypothetical protein CDG81_13565 [Actinopolyspora erythraea]|nr:hypothetical protein [Actinopolyspora erythraea]ASU79145.1 hypothetical protein CDG81_13565 [Actinopolyspora erythraea]
MGMLALAAHYFGRADEQGQVVVPLREARFFAYRTPQAWDRWDELSGQERLLVCRVMSLLDPQWTQTAKFITVVRGFLGKNSLEDTEAVNRSDGWFTMPPDRDDAVLAQAGKCMLTLAEEEIAPLFTPGQRPRALPFAEPDTTYATRRTYVGSEHKVTHREIRFARTPLFTTAPGHDVLPRVTTRPQRTTVAPSGEELLRVAALLAKRPGTEFLYERLENFFQRLRGEHGAVNALDLLTGQVQLLNAPTGSAKSVLMRVTASWAALEGYRLALVVPDVPTTLKVANDIAEDLAHLRQIEELPRQARCTPLMSPRKRHTRAVNAAHTQQSPLTEWDNSTLGSTTPLAYGCGQRSLMDPPDLYEPGEENCTTLYPMRGQGPLACPLLPVCDKHTPVYDAVEADVIVTNHANLIQGKIHTGVVLDDQHHQGHPRGTRDVSVLELMLRCTDAMVIDEIDAFQKTAIDRCTSELLLASHKRQSTLRQLDEDIHRLSSAHQQEMLTPLNHAFLVAELLLLALVSRSLTMNPSTPVDSDEPAPGNEGWRLAYSRDREIIQLLFEDDLAGEDGIPDEVAAKLAALMPDRWKDPNCLTDPRVIPQGDQVREALRALVAPRGENLLEQVRNELHTLLAASVTDPRRRSAAVNLLATRTLLVDLDEALSLVRSQSYTLAGLNLPSVHKILNSLHRSSVARMYPLSALGRSLHGYQAAGLDEPAGTAELRSRRAEGDPHTFVAQLGGATALMAAGVQRPVLGLSATGFFPQAVAEHVHAPVRWWVPDDQPRSIVIRDTPVRYDQEEDALIRVGGLPAERKPATLRKLARGLYEQHLRHTLITRARDTRTAKRARAALVTNSYDQAGWLAQGLAAAADSEHRVVLLCRDHPDRQRWQQQLPANVRCIVWEQVEQFPQLGEILLAPLAVIARGLNIVIDARSAISDIYLCVRPVLSLDESAWMHGSVNAAGINSLPPGGSSDPMSALDTVQRKAWDQQVRILRSSPRLTTMADPLQEELVAGLLVDLIQLAGRARRGDTEMTLHFVDHALHDETFRADLRTIIHRIYQRWTPQQQRMMTELYGEALQAFLSYAGIH